MSAVYEKVSIVMPVKNGTRTIEQAIISVQKQSYSNWELLIVDDHSTDGLNEFLARHLEDSRIKLFSNRGQPGVPQAMNLGLASATGSYFARLDCDDLWLAPEKLTEQVEYLSSHPECVLVGTWAAAGSVLGQPVYEFHHASTDEQIRQRILFRNPVVSSSLLARMSSIKQIGGYHSEDQLAEDYGLVLRLAELGKLANLPILAVWYGLSQSGITRTRYSLQVQGAREVVKNLGRSLPGYGLARAKWWLHHQLAAVINLKLFDIVKKALN